MQIEIFRQGNLGGLYLTNTEQSKLNPALLSSGSGRHFAIVGSAMNCQAHLNRA
jgi:hypothetical protein